MRNFGQFYNFVVILLYNLRYSRLSQSIFAIYIFRDIK